MQDELTIAAVLEHYGADLTRVHGIGWRALRCPFHDDRNASASVSLSKNAFACHACGVKGDVISLIRRQEGLGYNDAVRYAQEVLGASVGDVRATARSERKRRPSRWRERLSL